MTKIRLSGQFDNWVVDTENGILFDDGNNDFSINEIRAIFFYRQLANTKIGSNYEIASLKEHLEKKIKSIKTPVVTIDWGDKIEIIEKS